MWLPKQKNFSKCAHMGQPVGRPLVRVLRLLKERVRGTKQQLGVGCIVLQQLGAASLPRAKSLYIIT